MLGHRFTTFETLAPARKYALANNNSDDDDDDGTADRSYRVEIAWPRKLERVASRGWWGRKWSSVTSHK